MAPLAADEGEGAGAPEPTPDDYDPTFDDYDPTFDEDLELSLVPPVPDPLEPVNRGIFGGNRILDRFLLEPIARGYGWLVPDPAKRSVRNFFENLNEPVVIVNDLLQLEGRRAGTASTRFLVNTTVGVVGLFDPAERWGFEQHHADFGQTLGKAGVGPGIYLVVPVLGPSTTRDLVGDMVDLALRPDMWLLPLTGNLLVGGTGGITLREEVHEEMNALEASSVDFYAAIRSAYLMQRAALVRDEASDPAPEPDGDDPPDARGVAGGDGAAAAGGAAEPTQGP